MILLADWANQVVGDVLSLFDEIRSFLIQNRSVLQFLTVSYKQILYLLEITVNPLLL